MKTVAESRGVRAGFEEMQYKNIPTSDKGVASLVSQFATEVSEEKKDLIKTKLANVLKFSVTTDDYTKHTMSTL